jgi:hypothetical protein
MNQLHNSADTISIRSFPSRLATSSLAVAIVLTMMVSIAHSDPCGMVPPIYVGDQSPIARVGLQKTYVFYKDGVETFVIRPGFSGNIDNFGMLIPFPNPPELRKVSDNIFEQVANAVDPPEVVVDLRVRRMMMKNNMGAAPASASTDKKLEFRSRVKVLKKEAVGMYEVAVLEAGSADALKLWMDQNGYQYPDGMDKVTNDYVDSGWCFVAVKTKVGSKDAAEPRPGQRTVNAKLPAGSVFDGNVQGMGFRFKSEELVVPMRLSAFNEGELRNVMYLLTDGPRKIRAIPEEYVVRQISGQDLFDNVTKPLPLRIIGGTEADIPQFQRTGLPERRNPIPQNGVARDLFAADLIAATGTNLSLDHEEQEKELLRIGEHLGLRGGEADAVNREALLEARELTTKNGLAMLKDMTLTVVDGDFPREVIANENLTFAEFKMPAGKNNTMNYDANRFGPGLKKQGVLKVGALDHASPLQRITGNKQSSMPFALKKLALPGTFGIMLFGLVITLLPRTKNRSANKLITVLVISIGLALSLGAVETYAARTATNTALLHSQYDDGLIEKLASSKTAHDAMAELRKRAKANEADRESIVQSLLKVAKEGEQLPKRGWAIAALAEIGGQDVDEYLLNIHASSRQPKLVRTWAAAARVSMTRTVNGLIEKANLVPQFPSLGRPIGIRIVEKMNGDGDKGDPEKVLAVTQKVPQLQTSLAPAIMAFGAEKLSDVMLTAKDNNVRRIAAGYLGAMAGKGDADEVVSHVIERLQFDASATSVPWKRGALFIPSINWSKEDALSLVGNLIRWHLWCDINQKTNEQKQIHNNIRSLGLARAAGYQSPGWQEAETTVWLTAFGKAAGADEIKKILAEQGVSNDDAYSAVLKSIK